MGLAASSLLNQAQAACVQPVLRTPTQTVINEALPRFEWEPVPNASHYLVWLESRVPEGRVLLMEEFQTSVPYVIPARPLTSSTATVRLRVTAVCKDDTQAELSARFRIAEDPLCRLKAHPVVKLDQGQWSVQWEKLPSALRYGVRVHAVEDGKTLIAQESQKSLTRLGPLQSGAWLVAVQPVCRGLNGVTSWVAVESH